jgi:acyl CoA:acetate/3-ketoacid CoA transferase
MIRLVLCHLHTQKIDVCFDVEKDITSKMGFIPIVGSIKEMDKRIFNDGKMGIRDEIVEDN